jgi:rhodanese-related sulfurtransferase
MKIKNTRLLISLLIGYLIISTKTAHAVIPPDFIFSIGTQVAQFFSVTLLFFTAILGTFFQFFKTSYSALKHKKFLLFLSIIAILLLTAVSSYFYASYKQKQEYRNWLRESSNYTTIKNDLDDVPHQITLSDSSIKISVPDNLATIDIPANSDNTFFEMNKNTAIAITNEQFQDALIPPYDNYVVLDARENIEYENGHFPESLHVRFADLKAGRWLELPKDKYIYVLCWSGIRGKEVAEFLRTKENTAFYLKNGANGWVKSGGEWIGDIKFNKKYNESRYKIVLDTKVVKTEVTTGAVLVDTREPYKFKQSHIPGSFNIPTMYIPTIDFEKTLQQIPPHSKVITVCDGYVNCFDAKITGVELERRGHQFLGRYNKPWEYEKK